MRRVHVHSENLIRIQDYKAMGWKEVKRFGDLVEFEIEELTLPEVKQRALGWFEKTMLTIKSGLNKELKWKR